NPHSREMWKLVPILLLSTPITSEFVEDLPRDETVRRLLTEATNEQETDPSSLSAAISNPWVRSERLEHGFGNLTWTSKSVVPRLFADMGRAGFPPITTVMKWPCWSGVEEKAKEEFREIFNPNNTKREVKEKLDEWIFEYNGTEIAEKIRFHRDDFENRMKLFSINFEAALSTLSTAVRTFNDVALDDGMTIAQSTAVLNNIADILDRNFVKSLYYLFNGNVMNGKKLQKIISKASGGDSTTRKPGRMTPPAGNYTTGNGGVWSGGWKRYTVIRRVTHKPNEELA
ncbi:hypothetical protein PMAYCL1PPCAC_28801, partial [Pristionchus mayeri]